MIITLTTDFGIRDSFVGAMKGVILGIAPAVRIVDLSHGIPPGDVRKAAFALMTAAPFFPAGTIHIAVIDPGVGGSRKAIAIRTQDAIFIGPDNGVLSWAVKGQEHLEMRSVENKAFLLERVSSTFHGRDLFAPAAAWLASGKDFRDLGPELHEFQREAWNDPVRVQLGWQTEVIHVDGYGNAITAFRADHPHRVRSVLLADGRRLPLEQFYGAVAKGSALAVKGSSGFVEIAVNQGNAAVELGLDRGSEVIIA